MAVLFGFPGMAMANQASIKNTGPDSYNKIEFNNSQRCNVENNNSVKAVNKVTQNAETGDAIVGSSDWYKYDPAEWAARGKSYGEWEAAVNSYMTQNKSNWRNNWGHSDGNTTGGNATSGKATNLSNNSTSISIDNSDACALGLGSAGNGDHDGKGYNNTPGNVLGKSSYHQPAGEPSSAKGSTGGHMLGTSSSGMGYNTGNMNVTSPSANWPKSKGAANYPTVSGGTGGKGNGNHGDNGFSINNTGPDSYNKINYQQSSQTNIINNNNVIAKNLVTQHATSGNSTVSGNTTTGNAAGGGAHNSSGNSTSAGINN